MLCRGSGSCRKKLDKSRTKNMYDYKKKKNHSSIDELVLKNRALAATDEGITITDIHLPDNPVIYVNPAFELLTGYPADEILGRNARFLQCSESNRETVTKMRKAISQESGCTVEIRNRKKDGTLFWNRFSITPVRDENLQTTHYIGIHRDVTRRRETEEALRKSKEALGHANIQMKRDLEAAANLQRSLLPIHQPHIENLNIAWDMEPCEELAGDTLNIVKLDEEHIGIYIVDVSGHGVTAALLSITLNRWLSPNRTHSCLFIPVNSRITDHAIASPVDVVEKLNVLLPMDTETLQFFTILYGIFNVSNRQFRYVSTGHPAPVYIPYKENPRLTPSAGFPVGFVPNPEYNEQVLNMDKGDRLYIYTDGIIETFNDKEEEFGTERLMKNLARKRNIPLQKGLESVMVAAKKWAKDSKIQDDAAILGIEVE